MTAQARSAVQLGNVANAVSRSLTILGSTGSIGDSTLSLLPMRAPIMARTRFRSKRSPHNRTSTSLRPRRASSVRAWP